MTILCSPKVTQHHGQVNRYLPPANAVFASGQDTCGPAPAELGQLAVVIGTRMSFRKVSTLRASGADDGTANRTPSAWMISLAPSLARGQIVFFVWVTLTEHKWVILAERRGEVVRCVARRRTATATIR